MNKLTEQKSWMKKNRIWFIPILTLSIIIIFMFFGSGLSGKVKDISKAYADSALYDNAIQLVKKDSGSIKILGKIEPTDNFAIAEGYVKYSEDNKEVRSTIRIKGSKERGKLDIYAERNESTWSYKQVKIRLRAIEKPIIVIGN